MRLYYCGVVLFVTGTCIALVSGCYPMCRFDDDAAPPTGETEKLERELLEFQCPQLALVDTGRLIMLAGLRVAFHNLIRGWPKSNALLWFAFILISITLCSRVVVIFHDFTVCTLNSTPAAEEMKKCVARLELLVNMGFLFELVGIVTASAIFAKRISSFMQHFVEMVESRLRAAEELIQQRGNGAAQKKTVV